MVTLRLTFVAALLWASPALASVVQTITLISTSGSTVAASTPSPPMFGLQFPSCAVDATKCVASGQYPMLQATDGTAWPATFIQRSSWSDGSIKHISVLPGPFPKAIPTTGVTANVLNGGTAPAASGISTTQLYAEGCQVNANGFSGALGTGLGLQGNWSAALASNANNIEVVDYGDGGGGHIWRILTNVQSGGTAHGQMEVYWYVQGLVNASGGLAGWRILPDLTQPWYDVDSPAKNWRGLQTFNLACGSTTLTPPFPYTSADFTAANYQGSGTNAFNPSATPNWKTCQGNNLCKVAGYFTTTGTLPAGVLANTIYCGIQNGNVTYIQFVGCDATTLTITDAGTGTHTFHPIPLLLHFAHLIGATVDGRYQYLQGAGTVAADAPIRITFDNAAREATHVFPPYDLTLSPTPNANVSPLFGATPDFDIANSGPLALGNLGVGERDDIGILTAWQARHFYNQTLIDEKYVRNIGLVAALFASNVRDRTTLGRVNLAEAPGAQSYTGLPASLSTTFAWGYRGNSGFTPPAHGLSQLFFDTNNFSHMPHLDGYAYLVTGEPQYLDYEKEQANETVFDRDPTLGTQVSRNPVFGGTTYYGDVMTNNGWGFRDSAWSLRELTDASALSPDTDPAGTADKQYFTDLRTHATATPPLILAQQGTYTQSIGLWLLQGDARQEYQMGYMNYALARTAAEAEDSGALSTLQNINAVYYNHLYTMTGNSSFSSVNYATYAYDTGIYGQGPFAPFPCNGTWAAGVATVSCAGPINAIVGMKMLVDFSSSGFPGYDGTFPLTAVLSDHSFQYALAVDPGGAGAGSCRPIGTEVADDAHLAVDFLMELGPDDLPRQGPAFWTNWQSGTPGTFSKNYWDYSGQDGPGGATWHPADGDKIIFPIFNSGTENNWAPPGGLSYATPYYQVNTHFGSNAALSYASGTIHVTTAAAHGLTIGQHYNIGLNGTAPAGYQWSYDCTVIDTTHFDCASPLRGDPGTATYFGTWNTFNLATSPGGSPLAISTTGLINDNFRSGMIPASPPSGWIGTDFVQSADAYPANMTGGFNFMQAVGVTGISTMQNDAISRFNGMIAYFGRSRGVTFQSNPKFAMTSSFGNPAPAPAPIGGGRMLLR